MTGAPVTRWFLDTEFNEDGRTIELISIALVSDDGREYYAVSADFDPAACNDWVKANVLPLLPAERRPRGVIASEVREMLLADGSPEVWAYFADYDWVALCQLFGPMVALPKGFPMFCMDLKQLMVSEGIGKDRLPQQAGAAHDALADARWARDAHACIREMTHDRKPDVLPVEGASIAEALEALTRMWRTSVGTVAARQEDMDVVRSALERAAAEGEARGWKPFYFDDATPVREGQFCVFMAQGIGGDCAVFADSIVWDAETDAQWNDGSHGFDISDATHFMPLPAPPKGST